MPAKKTKRKKSVRKAANKTVQGSFIGKKLPLKKYRTAIVVKNLILFGALFLLSVVVALISNNEIIDQLFWILAILTGFVIAALLIVLLIFFFMKQIKK
jgi:hypothetical protein